MAMKKDKGIKNVENSTQLTQLKQGIIAAHVILMLFPSNQ